MRECRACPDRAARLREPHRKTRACTGKTPCPRKVPNVPTPTDSDQRFDPSDQLVCAQAHFRVARKERCHTKKCTRQSRVHWSCRIVSSGRSL